MIKQILIPTLILCSTWALSAQNSKHSDRAYLDLSDSHRYMEIPSHPDFDIPTTRSYTISLWFWGENSNAYAMAQRLVSRHQLSKEATTKAGYELMGMQNVGKHFVGVLLTDEQGSSQNAFDAFAQRPSGHGTREWYHIALVVDRKADKATLYIDATPQLSSQGHSIKNWSVANGLPILIGAALDGEQSTAYLNGRVDNIHFYHRALTPRELRIDAQTDKISPRTKDLVAAYDFDTYTPGDSIVADVTSKHPAKLHNPAPTTGHSIIRSYQAYTTNGNLIAQAQHQALGVIELGLTQAQQLGKIHLRARANEGVLPQVTYSLYATNRTDRYDYRSPGTLIAQGIAQDGSVDLCPIAGAPKIDSHSKLWVTVDLDQHIPVGTKIALEVASVSMASTPEKPYCPSSLVFVQEVVPCRSLLWAPGDRGSANYRIPAIIRLQDGTLVASADKRKNSNYDLPEDIDVEVRISHDNGQTWSDPITVAHGSPTMGYGDAAMATDGKNIYMTMVAGTGLWNYPANAQEPLRMYFSKSEDGGKSWTTPREISREVYTDCYPNGGFFGSGNGIVTRNGRIAFVAAMRTDGKWGGNMDNVMVYSDDQGQSWHASPMARHNGDEAKIMELSDGSLLISSRNRASRANARTFVTSQDGGLSWSAPLQWQDLKGNACNAAILRYQLPKDIRGGKEIWLHTLLTSDGRNNLGIYISEDQGQTWRLAKTICRGEAAYSELVALPNGELGIISEENDHPAYDIYFTRVPIQWLLGSL